MAPAKIFLPPLLLALSFCRAAPATPADDCEAAFRRTSELYVQNFDDPLQQWRLYGPENQQSLTQMTTLENAEQDDRLAAEIYLGAQTVRNAPRLSILVVAVEVERVPGELQSHKTYSLFMPNSGTPGYTVHQATVDPEGEVTRRVYQDTTGPTSRKIIQYLNQRAQQKRGSN